MFNKEKIDALLVENKMHPDQISLDSEIDKYLACMRAGLARKQEDTLLMLPTYLGGAGELPRGERAVVVDAGGTNLRVARLLFAENGKIIIEEAQAHPMPGSLFSVTKDQMFDDIAEKVAPLLAGCNRIGFCFSYVFESRPDRDGVIEAMSKEVEVSGVEGAVACAELEAALRRRGVEGRREYVMLNDTVATLFSAEAVHRARGFASFASMILGTGFNACYIEKTERITKIAPGTYPGANMIVNLEAGIYAGVEQGEVDRWLDEKSALPGDHRFEKMVSGGYFGDLIFGTLMLAAGRGLLSPPFMEALTRLGTVSLKEITRYIENRAGDDNDFERLARENSGDKQTLDYILDRLYLRAAKLVAVVLCSVAIQSGCAADPKHPLCFCVEGTTFYRSPLLTYHLDMLLRIEVAAARGQHIELVRTDDATLIGTALAALRG